MNQSTVVVGYLKWDGYVRGSIDLFGIISNLINIIVFLSPRLKDTSYKLMLVKAVSNLVYFMIAFETEILTFCVNCAWSSSYAAGFNYCYVYIYFSSCLHLLTIAIDVVLSVYTYCILINKPWPGRFTFLWISIALFAVTLAFYGQKPLVFAINPIPYTNSFYLSYSAFGASITNKTIQIAQNSIRIILSIVVVTVINVFNVVKFSKRFKSRIFALKTSHSNIVNTIRSVYGNVQSKDRAGKSVTTRNSETVSKSNSNENSVSMTRNITRMVIVSLFINVFGELPFGIILTISFFGVSSPEFTLASTIANILILLPSSLELITYYCFNKLFRGVIDDFFKRVRGFFIRI